MINTLETSIKLESSGFSNRQAKMLTEVIAKNESVEIKRIDELDNKVEKLDNKVEKLDNDIKDLQKNFDHKFEKIDERFERLEEKMDGKFERLEEKIDSKIEGLRSDIKLDISSQFRRITTSPIPIFSCYNNKHMETKTIPSNTITLNRHSHFNKNAIQ